MIALSVPAAAARISCVTLGPSSLDELLDEILACDLQSKHHIWIFEIFPDQHTCL